MFNLFNKLPPLAIKLSISVLIAIEFRSFLTEHIIFNIYTIIPKDWMFQQDNALIHDSKTIFYN